MRRSLILAVLICSIHSLFADNTGILKSRLIELSENEYLLEVELSPLVEPAIGDPVFPDRFIQVHKKRSEYQGRVTLQYLYSSGTAGLHERDILVLPWIVNGTSLTVFRQDGMMKQGLYLRRLEGIRISLETLFTEERKTGEILREWLHRLISASEHLLPFLLLALILASFGSVQTALRLSFMFFCAQSFSMVSGELGLPGPDLLYAQILVLTLAFYMGSFKALCSPERAVPALALAGFIFGNGLFSEISLLSYSTDLVLMLHIISIIYWSLVLTALSLVLTAALQFVKEKKTAAAILRYICAVFSLFFILLLFQERVRTGELDVLNLSARDNQSRYDLPDPQVLGNNQNSIVQGPEGPAQAYISVEPFELRIEVLLRLDDVMEAQNRTAEVLSIEDQVPVLRALEDDFVNGLMVYGDGSLLTALSSRADFVTMGSGGVSLRTTAVDELRSEGLLGLSLLFGTDELLEQLAIDWNFFPSGISSIPVRMSRKWGSESFTISREDNRWTWTNPVGRSLFPDMAELSFESAGFPLLFLLLSAGAFYILIRRRNQWLLAASLLVLSLLSYPVIRIPVPLNWTMADEDQIHTVAEALLTNLYRSFDVQTDSEVYDRLALSVSGELLQDVFLENRKAMVIENKGGARARMDSLELISLQNTERVKEGFRTDIEWTVDGSVSHFGHTHYRKNRYQALVQLTVEDRSWKISDIVMLREEREL